MSPEGGWFLWFGDGVEGRAADAACSDCGDAGVVMALEVTSGALLLFAAPSLVAFLGVDERTQVLGVVGFLVVGIRVPGGGVRICSGAKEDVVTRIAKKTIAVCLIVPCSGGCC